VAEVEEPELAPTEKSVPVPVRPTLCGLPTALSVTANDPVALPAAVGLKMTLIVQLAPAPTVVPHVLVSVKPLLAAMFEMLNP